MPAPHELAAVAALLAKLDICMLTTRASDGSLHGRPMSNNGEVEYDGDSWFFARDGSRKIDEIEADPHVELAFINSPNATWVNLEGRPRSSGTTPTVSDDCGWMTSSGGSRTGRTTLTSS